MYDFGYIGLPLSFLTEERVSQLIMEGKDPIELLKYKFQDVPENVIDAVISIDPTKKKSYSQWVLKKWDNESESIITHLKDKRLKQLFDFCKTHPDIQIKDIPSVEEGINMYTEEENIDTVLTKSDEPDTYVRNLHANVDSDLANDFDVVFNQDNWLIAVPNTYEAACKLGEGMKWCTSNAFGNGRSYYNNYLSRGGKYYVNFKLDEPQKGQNGIDYPYTRYQFHFESNQFMDSHDDPISFDEIDLPQSAYEFYEELGYNMEDYGLSDEEKMERYDNQRYQDSIHIFDDLYLNQQYDDNYEYTEPDESTDFYLFDENDDRDPIDWTDLPNSDDVIQYKNEETSVAVLKKKRNGYLIVYKDPTARGYRDYTVQECEIFSIHDNKIIAVTEGRNTYQTFFTDGKHISTTDIPQKEYEKLFINSNLPQEHFCVELVDEEGFHTLVEMAPESRLIVAMDLPFNGEYFQMDDNGYILGQYRKYPLLRETEMQDANNVNFQIEEKIAPNRLLVSMPSPEENVDLMYNILDTQNKKFILPFNFDTLIDSRGYAYIVEYDSQNYLFSLDGEQIGNSYLSLQYIEEPKYIYGVIEKDKAVIIDLIKREVIAQCKNIDLHFGRIKDGTIELNLGNGLERLYNYKTQEWVLPDYINLQRVKCYLVDDAMPYVFVLGKKENEQGYTLIELNSRKPIINNVKHTEDALWKTKMFKICFMDGTENMFNPSTMQLLLKNNVSKIFSSTDADYIGVFPYTTNNQQRIYFYNSHTNQNMVNPNGVDTSIMKNYNLSNSYDSVIIETKAGVSFSFPVNNNGQVKYRLHNTYYYLDLSQAQDKPEILHVLSELTGTDYTQSIKEQMKHQFNNLFKRIMNEDLKR